MELRHTGKEVCVVFKLSNNSNMIMLLGKIACLAKMEFKTFLGLKGTVSRDVQQKTLPGPYYEQAKTLFRFREDIHKICMTE